MEQTASGFYLYNDGAIVVSMHAVYKDNQEKPQDVVLSGNFMLKQSKTELLDGRCPNLTPGTSVALKVWIQAHIGDKTAAESYKYDPNGPIQGYKISGDLIGGIKLQYTGPMPQQPPWTNWVGCVQHAGPIQGKYYFMPKAAAELQQVLAQRPAGATVRVSGQRHSQPPLVVSDSRTSPPTATEILVDLSCYKDLGANQDQSMVLDTSKPDAPVLYVNAGVNESEVDAFLTANNMILQTATAGGFFSIGGMTAVDVHGSTIRAPIFAETACSFEIMAADGSTSVVDTSSPRVTVNDASWSPLQFARVSLGGLGVVTRIGLNVVPRPYKNTLQPGHAWYDVTENNFAATLEKLVADHERLEVFYNPYAGRLLALYWDMQNPSSPTKNVQPAAGSTCASAHDGAWGASLISFAKIGEWITQRAQKATSKTEAAMIVPVAMTNIESQMKKAEEANSELWLTGADYCIFMSYFIPLKDQGLDGMNLVCKGLQAVNDVVSKDDNFHIAAPVEFRFIRSGDSAMSGTYSTSATPVTFLNLDLIGFVDQGTEPAKYPQKLLQSFAAIERQWVKLGGLPHNGKMFGFYDPNNPDESSYTTPFNQNFLNKIAELRGAPQQAYKQYQAQRDPGGVFFNQYLRNLMGQS